MFTIAHDWGRFPIHANPGKSGIGKEIKSPEELYEWISDQMKQQKPELELILNESMTDSMRAELVG